MEGRTGSNRRSNSSEPRSNEIDGLRAVAVLLVIYSHLHEFTSYHIDTEFYSYLFSYNFVIGTFGVDIFFAISGFLITRIIVTGAEHRLFFQWFYFRRFLRIIPLAYAGVFLAYVLGNAFGYAYQWKDIAYNLLFFGNFRMLEGIIDPAELGLKGSLNHYWSLAIEEQFYIFWPITLLGFKRLRLRFFIVIAMIFISISVRAYFFFGDEVEQLIRRSYLETLPRLDGLGFGALAALAHVSYRRCERLKLAALMLFLGPAILYGFRGWLASTNPNPAHVAISILFIIFLSLYLSTWWKDKEGNENGFDSDRLVHYFAPISLPLVLVGLLETGSPIDHAVVGLASAGLILLLLQTQTIWNTLLSMQPIVYVGRISYGLYVYHHILFWFFADIVNLLPEPLRPTGPAFVVGRIVLVFIVAALSWRYFEKPIIDLKYKLVLKGPELSAPTKRRIESPIGKVTIVFFIIVAAVFITISSPSLNPSAPSNVHLNFQKLSPARMTESGHFQIGIPFDRYSANYLTDGDDNTYWHSPPADGKTPHWVSFEFLDRVVIRGVKFDSSGARASGPSNITILIRTVAGSWVPCHRLNHIWGNSAKGLTYSTGKCAKSTRGVRLEFDDTVRRMIYLGEVGLFGER